LKSLCRFLELLEPERQPVAISAILTPPRQLDHLSDHPLEAELEKRAIMEFEQPVRNSIAAAGLMGTARWSPG